MRRRASGGRAGRAVLGSALLLGVTHCGAYNEPCSVETAECERASQVKVAAWWATRGEYAPFDILERSLRSWTQNDASLAHSHQTKDEHMGWIEDQLDPQNRAPEPVDTFAANAGDEVMRWTPCGRFSSTRSDEPRLHVLNNPALGRTHIDTDWVWETFYPEIVDSVRCGEDIYALPVGVHRMNTLFYNKQRMRDAGYAVDGGPGTPFPATLSDLHDALVVLERTSPPKREGDRFQPSVFAVGARDQWTLSLFFIENVMLAVAADAIEYTELWDGQRCNERLWDRTLEEIEHLRRYFGDVDMRQDEALDRLKTGQSALFVMGDWAQAEVDPQTIGAAPFPGTSGYYMFDVDVFAIPATVSSDVHKGLGWLRAVTDEPTQREFTRAKGALSPRRDLPGVDDELTWVKPLPAFLPYGGDGGAAFSALHLRLADWLESDDPDRGAVLDYVRQEYPKLSGVGCETQPGATEPGETQPFEPPR